MTKWEILVTSTKERDRFREFHEVKQAHVAQRPPLQSGVTDRRLRKLLVRLKKDGGQKIADATMESMHSSASGRKIPRA
jgi:hypothetical protein